jgi:hypothetical protein
MEIFKALFALVDETVNWATKVFCDLVDLVADRQADKKDNVDDPDIVVTITRVRHRPWIPEGRKE